MIDALARIRERARQNRQARAESLTSSDSPRPTTAPRTMAPIREGTKVFDTVTGLEGEVVGGTTETVIVPATER